jgi:hypothetical protein
MHQPGSIGLDRRSSQPIVHLLTKVGVFTETYSGELLGVSHCGLGVQREEVDLLIVLDAEFAGIALRTGRNDDEYVSASLRDVD